MVKGVLLGALVQLGYKSPTKDSEEAILDVVKGSDNFVLGVGISLYLRQSSVHFLQYTAVPKSALPVSAPFEPKAFIVCICYAIGMDFRAQESKLKSPDCLSAMTLKMAVGSGLGTRLEEHLTFSGPNGQFAIL